MTGFAGDGVTTVAPDCQGSGDLYRTVGSVGADTGGDAVLLDETGGLPAHAQGEAGQVRGFAGEKVQEVPLRHECDEFAVSGNVREVGDGEQLAPNDGR